MDNPVSKKLYRQGILPGGRAAKRSLGRITTSPKAKLSVLIVLALACFSSGCAGLARKEVSAIEAKHGVNIEITSGAAAADLFGGNSLVALRNVDKELDYFPYQAKQGMNIHIGSGLDILAESKTLGDVVSTPLIGGATQDRPGKTQGDIYVLNKDLWGTYMDLSQPSTTMWQDPHLRHEFMHAYEINILKTTLFTEKWQKMLDQRLGKLNEMTHKLGYIDSISILASEEEIVGRAYRPYLDFCAGWIASMFGDLNADGRIDELDRQLLCARPGRFDIDQDGKLDYHDAARLTGLKHSMASGINPITQLEMTAGALGYRPKGFASAYGRTSPWEDKAEVLAYAIQKKIFPQLYRKAEPKKVAKAYRRLEAIRGKDPVLARKIEILAQLFGSLERPENRNSRFEKTYLDSQATITIIVLE